MVHTEHPTLSDPPENNQQPDSAISRRRALQLLLASVTGSVATGLGLKYFADRLTAVQAPEVPKKWTEMLKFVENLPYHPDTVLSSTLCMRKLAWELAELREIQGTWQGGDKSDWLSRMPEMDEIFARLATAGIKAGRLAIFPFEVTADGQHFDWSVMDKAITLFERHQMQVDICAGPFNFPYAPGARFPDTFQHQIRQVMAMQADQKITLSRTQSRPALRAMNDQLIEYGFRFLRQLVEKYTQHPTVKSFYLGNEWPDANGIEGVDGVTISTDESLMIEMIEFVKKLTDKKLVMNTNIPPSEPDKMKHELGNVIAALGSQGELGLDPYPTQEAQDLRLAPRMKKYGEYVQQLRKLYPGLELGFSELQAEWWPTGNLPGKSWAEITRVAPDQITQYFGQTFPAWLQPYLIESKITDVCMWGAPLWCVMSMAGDERALEVITAMHRGIQKRKK